VGGPVKGILLDPNRKK